ncbi:hypothetical protein [Allocoleopsis sp.]|uniref:hypothetical protein n=1 Tax=Allocoleopsis sp. TaxID=3088169 RepID=UPI002FD2EBCE
MVPERQQDSGRDAGKDSPLEILIQAAKDLQTQYEEDLLDEYDFEELRDKVLPNLRKLNESESLEAKLKNDIKVISAKCNAALRMCKYNEFDKAYEYLEDIRVLFEGFIEKIKPKK